MTPEELDEARAKEAWRKCDALGFGKDYESPAIIAARLAREGWMPPPPVDPDLLAVREIVATAREKDGWHDLAAKTKKGLCDGDPGVCSALAAYKAGREAEAERAKVLLDALDDAQQYGGQFDARKAALALAAYKAGKESAK
jgi:hypothetical protein